MKVHIEKALKKYGENTALDIGSLEFEEGCVYAVLGLNGSGKTTLLECIAGLNILDNGVILYDDSADRLKVKHNISIMAQKPYLFNMSVSKNVEMGLEFRKLNKNEITDRINKYITYFDMVYILNKNAKRLSGGEAARTAMLRTAVLETELTLFDEPTASMDIENTIKAEKLIKDISGDKRTVIIVTHDFYQAKRIADYIIFMDKGRIIEMGQKDKVLNNPENKLVKLILNI